MECGYTGLKRIINVTIQLFFCSFWPHSVNLVVLAIFRISLKIRIFLTVLILKCLIVCLGMLTLTENCINCIKSRCQDWQKTLSIAVFLIKVWQEVEWLKAWILKANTCERSIIYLSETENKWIYCVFYTGSLQLSIPWTNHYYVNQS